jgi:N-acetylmuramoyl-L-alanine amidase
MISEFDLDQVALTVWAEARGEVIEGQKAVIHVIKNRWQNPGWWSRHNDGIPDDTLAAVVRDPWQFSCWNPSDPQSKRLHDPKTLLRPDVQKIRNLVDLTLGEEDFTGGADHYCTKRVAPFTRWAKGRRPVLCIGNHQFYKIGLRG